MIITIIANHYSLTIIARIASLVFLLLVCLSPSPIINNYYWLIIIDHEPPMNQFNPID